MPPKSAAAVGTLILLAVLCRTASAAVKPGCELIQPWSDAKAARATTGPRVSDWAAQQKWEWEALQISAKKVFEAYRGGELANFSLSSCLDTDEDRESFQSALPAVFFSRSLELLSGPASPPALRDLARTAQEEVARGNGFLFRLSGHFIARPEGAPLLGGFHRGARSIFLDFEAIPSREWLLVFAHELVHALDPRLREATVIYNRDAAAVSEHTDSQLLEKWLIAGLDRGYLAEARAWTLTALYYSDGRGTELWPQLPWMEEMLKSCGTEKPGMPELLVYLDPRFEDPSDGVFALPNVRDTLRAIRRAIREKRIRPELL